MRALASTLGSEDHDIFTTLCPDICAPFVLAFLLQTYLEQNEGPGLQHLALKTNDIIHTVGEMAKRSQFGGFEFMPRPSEGYYGKVAQKVVSVGRC